ncbi:TPA: MATE family efflux transporter [Legionella pneumophila]|uniref:MATE family efflux transporter n=1 Tax=Legionella pneumophila TaxID=446 RepID=UPI0007770B5C|nr:MATE family efflux transporter [Legionella pneumophila]HAT8647494.1 MATE family efflux transporter [Legionella pneumophila]HAU0838078.1 MATE family efflux transporter [Legionella pneumophila]HAU0882164.1 MATE family efflux transporter [Legionella pneumophila]
MKLFQDHFFLLIRLAIPLAVTGLLQSGVFFFETLFLARLGPDILAAGALVSWLFGTFVVILFGTLSSINILVAHKFGSNDHKEISLVVRDGFWLSLILVIPAFLLFWNMAPIFLVLGQSPTVVSLAESYLHAMAWGLLPNFLMTALFEMIIGLGQAHVILKFSLLSVVLTIFLSFGLIFGKLGLPALGIAGAGWGMTISFWITVLALSVYLFMNKTYHRYFNNLLIASKPSYLIELLRLGFPMGLMYSIEVGFFFTLSLIMGLFSSQILAANQVAMQYLGTLMSVIFSIAQAITVRMGHLLGSGETAAAKKAANAGICISFTFMLIVAVFYWFFPKILISIDFNPNKSENIEIIRMAAQILTISAIFQIAEATRISLFGALRSLKDTRFTLFISIFSFWIIALPIGYFLATRLNIGGTGLWWGMVLGAVSSVLLLHWRFKFKIQNYQNDLTSTS